MPDDKVHTDSDIFEESINIFLDGLFTNRWGEQADRLAMMKAGKNIGGWSREAVTTYWTWRSSWFSLYYGNYNEYLIYS